LVGIEVQAGATVTVDDFKGLKALAVDAGKRWVRGIILYSGSELLPFGENLVAMPISALWRLA
jgi:hypothetical protein